MNRRELLATLGLLTATTTMTSGTIRGPLESIPELPRTDPVPPKAKSLRIAHLTDAHIETDGVSAVGLRRCLEHVHNLERPPDLILNGGDSIMDAFNVEEERALAQWETWRSVIDRHLLIPTQHCLGNHDVHYTPNSAKLRPPDDGKDLAMEMLGLPERYYSVDLGPWKLVVLDSVHLTQDHYIGRLDEEQFVWLEATLDGTPAAKPIVVLSHIPILSACAYFDGDNESGNHWNVPGAWMHIDARRIKNLFNRHSNVRLCLSGHIHLRDRVEYNGVTYLCNGAVCGDWWRGAYQECPPGYSVIDLYPDGKFEEQYLTYG